MQRVLPFFLINHRYLKYLEHSINPVGACHPPTPPPKKKHLNSLALGKSKHQLVLVSLGVGKACELSVIKIEHIKEISVRYSP